jgi:hypothetical protein
MKDATIIYLWMSFVTVLTCSIIFQVALDNMTTNLLGWWEPDSNNPMFLCGPNAKRFDTGTCTLGYGFYLLVCSLLPLNISYNIFKFTLNKKKTSKDNEETAKHCTLRTIVTPTHHHKVADVVQIPSTVQYKGISTLRPNPLKISSSPELLVSTSRRLLTPRNNQESRRAGTPISSVTVHSELILMTPPKISKTIIESEKHNNITATEKNKELCELF